MSRIKLKNSRGEDIVLNAREQLIANFNRRHANALGYEIDTTTLTTVIKEVTEQKFYEVAIADYLPVKVGNGAFSTNLITYRSFNPSSSFADGIIDQGGDNSRLASVNTGVDSVTVRIKNWAKTFTWSLFQIEQAARSGSWDLISALEESRKTNWDLGLQRVAFLGLDGDPTCLGLFTQTGITTNTTFISGPISGMAPTDLKYFCQNILGLYRSNCNRTAFPTHFVIPESDYLGLASASSPEFPIKSTLQLLEETFQVMTKNANFKIMPSAYADSTESGQSYQQYALYNSNARSLRMDIPVDYTSTVANSIDGFSYQNAAYGQFTGVQAYRPAEMYYLRYTV